MNTRFATFAALLAFSGIASGALSGCAVGPDFMKPETATQPSFLGAGEAGATATSGDVLQQWWSHFGDKTLDSLIADAVRSNVDLRGAISRVNQARAIRREKFLDLFPTVTSDLIYTRTQTPTQTFAGGAFPSSSPYIENEYYNVGLDAVWELDIFGRVRRGVESKDAESAASVAQLHDAVRILVAEVARTYIDLRGTQLQVSVSEKNARTQEQVVKVAQALFQGGQSTEFDVVRSRSQHSTTLATIPPLQARAKADMYRLAVLCGKQPQELVPMLQATAPLPSFSGPLTIGDPATLLQRRPDLQAAEHQLHAATAGIGVAKGDLWPKITFSGSLGFQSSDWSGLSGGEAGQYAVTPTLSWAAFNLGRVFARIDQSEAAQQQALAAYEQAVLIALEETEGALVQFTSSKQRRDYLKDSVDQSGKAVAIARTQYENGLVDLLPVLDAQRALLSNQLQLAESEVGLLSSLVSLFKALGGGWNDAISEVKSEELSEASDDQG
jgi:multidrug efflux system outer membrane protein